MWGTAADSPDVFRAPEVRWISMAAERAAARVDATWPGLPHGRSAKGSEASGSCEAPLRSVSCVLPAQGTYRQVSQLLPRLTQALEDTRCPWELLVIVAGAVDPAPLGAWSWLPGVRVGVCETSLTWAQTLKAGLQGARGAAVIVVDLGVAHKLDALPAMVSSWDGAGQIVFAERRSGQPDVQIRKCSDDTPEFLNRLHASGVGAIDSDMYLMDRRVVSRLLR